MYAFRSAAGEVVYVGKAVDLRARVRTYFGSDPRRLVRGFCARPLASTTEGPTEVEAEGEGTACDRSLAAALQPSFEAATAAPACALAEIGGCAAPCTGEVSPEHYEPVAEHARAALRDGGGATAAWLTHRMHELSGAERYHQTRWRGDPFCARCHPPGRRPG